MKYAIVSQCLKSVTLQEGVIYHRIDDIVQCLIYTLTGLLVSISQGFTVANIVTHMLANVENQLDTRSSGLSIFWSIYIISQNTPLSTPKNPETEEDEEYRERPLLSFHNSTSHVTL